MAVESANSEACVDSIREPYLQALSSVERLHRRLLEVIKDEFERRGRSGIAAVQGLLLYSIGTQELSVGELRTRGYYLGTNVTYNLKKLVDLGLVEYQRSRVDLRSVRIKLTANGLEVFEIVNALCQKHAQTVEQAGGINADEFAVLNKLLHRLERFWTDQVVYRL
jgi:DNA-binding MarR family transcriptional regulator